MPIAQSMTFSPPENRLATKPVEENSRDPTTTTCLPLTVVGARQDVLSGVPCSLSLLAKALVGEVYPDPMARREKISPYAKFCQHLAVTTLLEQQWTDVGSKHIHLVPTP